MGVTAVEAADRRPDGTVDCNTPLRSNLRLLYPEVCIIKYFIMGVDGGVEVQLHSEV
jgi:hypothetical protein